MSVTLHKPLLLVVLLLALFAFSNVVSSSRSPVSAATTPVLRIVGEPGEISADAYAVFVIKDGTVLASANTDSVLPIASVTKLATAAAVFDSTDLEEVVTVSSSDLLTEGRAGKLQAGEEYTYRELLFPLLLESSNDAAAVYERVTDSDVVVEMNQLAEAAGLTETYFADASGLSDKNVSTIGDLVDLVQYLVDKHPAVLDITRLKNYVGPYSGLINNSPVIAPGYLGGKHGYTTAANRTLVAVFEEEFSGDSLAVGYVVLGSENLVADMEILRTFVRDSVRFE